MTIESPPILTRDEAFAAILTEAAAYLQAIPTPRWGSADTAFRKAFAAYVQAAEADSGGPFESFLSDAFPGLRSGLRGDLIRDFAGFVIDGRPDDVLTEAELDHVHTFAVTRAD